MRFYKKQLASLVMATLLAAFGPATNLFAATVDLCTGPTTITMPDGVVVPVWGFGLTPVSGSCPVTIPGPPLTSPNVEPLTINLTNFLPVPVSIYIPGLQLAPVLNKDNADGKGMRVRSFSIEVPAATGASPSGPVPFTFSGLKPGTFIYQSGTNPSAQVPMGLYGALVVNGPAGQAYNAPNTADNDSSYNSEQTIVLSEIDPKFNNYVNSNLTTVDAVNNINYSLSYAPSYYLINGKTFPDTSASLLAAKPGQKTLLRLINAGVQNHVPTIAGVPMWIVGEDGNHLPYGRKELAPVMGAGKTLDAIIDFTAIPATSSNFYSLYDRRSWRANSTSSTGAMLAFINSYDTGPNCSAFKGDMNGDSRISMADVLIVLNDLVSSVNNPNGDVSPVDAVTGLPCGKGTGVLTLSDVMYILRKALGVN